MVQKGCVVAARRRIDRDGQTERIQILNSLSLSHQFFYKCYFFNYIGEGVGRKAGLIVLLTIIIITARTLPRWQCSEREGQEGVCMKSAPT